MIALLLSVGLPPAAADKYTPRTVLPFDTEWTFNYFPASTVPRETTARDFDDSSWPAVSTPHTWSTYETTGDVHPFIMAASERMDPYWWKGWGVYRKSFVVGPEVQDKLLFVEFDGVQKYAEVYLNGEPVGTHKGGYTGFSVALDAGLHRDGHTPNVLTVLVSNRRDDLQGGIPPMTAGNFNVYGGIYRQVRLVTTDRIHIPFQGAAEHEGGIYWQTPFVSAEQATLAIDVWVKNAREEDTVVRLSTTVSDASGNPVLEQEMPAELPAGEISPLRFPLLTVKEPELWGPDSPVLYSIRIEVWEEERLRDTWTAPLGFRHFRWDHPTNTLHWNGRPVKIGGTNRHQDYPWIGDALPRWMHERDLEEIRHRLNHNFMRTAHYPQDPYVYDLTDRLGIITVAEVPNIKSISFSDEVQHDNLVEMVRRFRNHASIFMWGMGNETSDAADSAWAAKEDATRLLHQRKSEGYGDYVTHTHEDLDMESLLRVTVRGWYTDDVKDYEPVNSPDLPKSGQVAGTEEWQHVQSRIQDSNIRGLVNAQGVAWLYADHGADRLYRNSPLKNVNAKGWVDLYHEPKYMYYLWQANWAVDPMIYVRPFYWQEPFVGQRRSFQVDSNADEVELMANGRSLGRQEVNETNFHTVAFDGVPVEKGSLTGIAYRDGVEVARHDVRMPGRPHGLRLTASHHSAVADRAGLIVIRAEVVDEHGVRVLGARPDLHWSVEGPGSLVGPEVWQTDFDKVLADAGTWYIDTPVANLLRTSNRSGRITVRVSSPGLKTGEVRVDARPAVPPVVPGVRVLPLPETERRPVTRNEDFEESFQRLEMLAPMAGNHNFSAVAAIDLPDTLRAWLVEKHAPPVPAGPVFESLIENLLQMVQRSGRELIGDDFNHLIQSYNDLASLQHFVGLLPWHPEYREAWMAHLAERTLAQRVPLDVAHWERFFRSIPVDGRFVLVSIEGNPGDQVENNYRNTQFLHRTRGPSMEAVMTYFEPAWSGLSAEERQRWWTFFAMINPSMPDLTLEGSVDLITNRKKWRLWIPEIKAWREMSPMPQHATP